MSVCIKKNYFQIKSLKSVFWEMSNGEKSLVLACCITYGTDFWYSLIQSILCPLTKIYQTIDFDPMALIHLIHNYNK